MNSHYNVYSACDQTKTEEYSVDISILAHHTVHISAVKLLPLQCHPHGYIQITTEYILYMQKLSKVQTTQVSVSLTDV